MAVTERVLKGLVYTGLAAEAIALTTDDVTVTRYIRGHTRSPLAKSVALLLVWHFLFEEEVRNARRLSRVPQAI